MDTENAVWNHTSIRQPETTLAAANLESPARGRGDAGSNSEYARERDDRERWTHSWP
jgi:hypothetical protein